MAKGKRRRSRRNRQRSNGISQGLRSSLSGNSLSRSLRLEQLEDRRMLATFNVVSADDLRDDGNGGIEVVPGSLRDILEQANAFNDADIIQFSGPAFENPTTIVLEQDMGDFGQLDITNPVEIVGLGASKLFIHSASGKRIFLVDDGSENVTINVTISGITLSGIGGIAGDDEDGRGGAILNREALALNQMQIRNSSAPNGGGAIFNQTGSLDIEGSLIRDNTSGQGGGGIQNGLADQTDNLPSLTVVNSTITGNTANGNPGEMGVATGYGGGVLNSAGYTGIIQSTVYDNLAEVDGGGVGSQGFDPELDDMTMMPTVYSGNATTTIRSSIIVGNTTPPDPMVGPDPIPNDVGSVGVVLGDASAMPPTMDAPFDPQINSDGFNLFGILTHPSMTANMSVNLPTTGTDMDGIDPKSLFLDDGDMMNPRAVLGDFGGDTRVFMLDPSKSGAQLAIDMGDPMKVTGNYDQRGRHFRRVSPDMGFMDIGAVEVQNGLFIVDTLVDESDGEYRVNDFSLREALEFSAKNPFRDTISFSFDLLTEIDPNPFTPAPTIVLTLGELPITTGVDILGPTFQLEVDGNHSSRIFNIQGFDPANKFEVLISDLTIANGGGAVSGGAIINNESLTLHRSYLLGSSAALNGGALYAQTGTVVIDSSTFFDNNSSNNGGAIFVDSTSGAVQIINSTISNNIANNRGAGLANLGPNTSVEYSTITLNNASTTRGSGIANLGTGMLFVRSSIVSGNSNNTDIEFFGGPGSNITSFGYNLVGGGNAIDSNLFQATGDLDEEFDPKLANLVFTGGPTPTHRLLEDSLAVDAGDPSAAAGFGGVPEFDQRGGIQFVRVFDSDVDGTPRIDIGAYELQEVTYTVDSTADENDGDFTMGNLSLREAIEIANASISTLPEKIVFDGLIVGGTIILSPFSLSPFTTPDIKITGPVNIEGTGMTINGSALRDTFTQETWPMFTIDDGDDSSSIAVSFDGFSFENGADRAIVSKEDVVLSSFVATGNTGVVAHSVGTLTIKTSVLTGNSSPNDGGAIVVTDGNLIVEGVANGYGYTLITGNSTTTSGGNGGGISFSDSTAEGKTLSLNKVILSGNRAPAGTADGGGIYILGNNSAASAAMSEVDITDSVLSGNVTTGSNSEGGGIFAKNAAVTLTGSTVSLNRSLGTNSKGGGIYLSGGSLTVENSATNNSLITQNSTAGNYASGGGIANIGGDVVLNQVTISRNTTAGLGTRGAGIYSTGGNLTLNGTTVSLNSSEVAGFLGAGIYSQSTLAGTQKTSIINSTISGNTAALRGGGVFNAGGLLEIKYSTITNNSVPFFGNGGGVASFGNSATTRTEVRSSIIAGNFASADVVNPNSDVESVAGVANSFVSLGYNVIGLGLPLALDAFDQTGDQTNIDDPGLAPLTLDLSEGPTATHALVDGSPAINAGDPNAVAGAGNVPTYDQRGAGFSRVSKGRIDVGSYESDLSPVLASSAADFDSDGDVDGSDFLTWQLGFGQPAGPSGGDANNDGTVNGADLTIWETDFGTGSVAALSAASSSQDILVAPLEPLPGAPVLIASPVIGAEEVEEFEAAADTRLLAGLTLTTDTAAIDSTAPALVAEEANVEEGRDHLFADFAALAVSGDYEDLAADQSEAEEEEEEEMEFALEDQVFALLGS